MPTIDLLAMLIVLTAACGYVNVRLLRLPPTIGLMLLTLLASLVLLAVGRYVPAVEHEARRVVEQFDLDRTLLHGMLGFLLFAGACTSTSTTSAPTGRRSPYWPESAS